MDKQIRTIQRQHVGTTLAISMMIAGCVSPATMGDNENAAGAGGFPVGMRESEGGKAVSEKGARSENTASVLPPPTNALACSTDTDCGSGFCVDEVCCDSACTGTCEACTAAKKSSGIDGECGPIKFDSDPDNECVIGSACDGQGTCKFYNGVPCPVGNECLSYCVDGVCCGNICSGACQSCSAAKKGSGVDGVCEPIAVGTDPDDECSAGACDGAGTCASIGGACTSNAQCGSGGSCVDNVCCDSACTGTCQACTAAKKGSGVDGICGPIKFDSNPDNECAIGSACDGQGTCKSYNGVPCTNANDCLSYCVDGFCCGNVCTGMCESCSAAIKGGGVNGACGPIVAGTDPEDECVDGVCDGAGQCVGCADPPGTLLSSSCMGADLYGTYTDANCGTYTQLIESNSAQCAPLVCNGVPAETCDGIDNDFDGQVDEGVCCIAMPEIADGADNDCNGGIDEATSCMASITNNPLVVLSEGQKSIGVSNNYHLSGYSGVRYSCGMSTGKWYWEVVLDSYTYDVCIGIANANSAIPADAHLGDIGGGTCYANATGLVFPGYQGYGSTYLPGDVISVVLDLDLGELHFWSNGVDQGVAPWTYNGGPIFPAVWLNQSCDRATVNFGPTFVHAPPVGFNAIP